MRLFPQLRLRIRVSIENLVTVLMLTAFVALAIAYQVLVFRARRDRGRTS